jgi:hypothetical protein
VYASCSGEPLEACPRVLRLPVLLPPGADLAAAALADRGFEQELIYYGLELG